MAETPDAIAEQGEQNRQTAKLQAMLANIQQRNPYGEVRYTGLPGSPGYKRQVLLNPTLGGALRTYQQSQWDAAHHGRNRLAHFQARRGPEIDLHGLGLRGRALTPGMLPGGIPGQDDRSIQRLESSTFRRANRFLQPQYADERRRLRSQLAQQGIGAGSAAAQRATAALDRRQTRGQNDLALGAVAAGRGEHSRLFQQALARRGQEAGFQNQQFSQLEQSRQNQLNQQLQARQQEMNELGTFQNMGNVQQPSFSPPAQPGVAPVNSLGYRAQQDASNKGFWGGLLGTGISALGALGAGVWSDQRLKKDVERVGGLYKYRLKTDPPGRPKRVGLMAQELEKVLPGTVGRGPDGTRYIEVEALKQALLQQGA